MLFAVVVVLVFLAGCGKSDPLHSQVTSSNPQSHRFEQLEMQNAKRGWAVVREDDATVVLRTEDGGSSWQVAKNLKMPSARQGVKFFFLHENFAWAAEWMTSEEGDKVIVHKTSDGGGTWSRAEFPIRLGASGQGLMNLVFTDETNGWLLARYDGGLTSSSLTLYRTMDGGATWTISASPDRLQTSGIAGELAFSDSKYGWISTSSPFKPILYRTADQGATWEEVTLELPKGIAFTDMSFAGQQVRFFNEQQGFYPMLIFDHENRKTYYILYKTDDGGRTWSPHRLLDEAGGEEASASFDFTRKNVYFLKDRQEIFQTGLDLIAIRPITGVQDFKGTGHELSLIDFTDDRHGWITVGDGAEAYLYRTEDGGNSWNQLEAKIIS
jgi:photosystem II stability/assembly factor-like uncharacterized protein